MSQDEKMFYTLAEAARYLHITPRVLMRKIQSWNIEIRRLPASNQEHIATRDVKLLEQVIKDPGFMA